MKLKKFLSVFLAVVFIFGACTSVSVLASEERNVLASGICGAEGDNLKWTLYADGELVISGEGEMNWYCYPFLSASNGEYAPWKENRNDVKVITLEEGVTSIGTYAFCRMKRLHRVNLPLSFEFYEDGFIQDLLGGSPKGAEVAICYPGTAEDWDKVKKKTVDMMIIMETGEISHNITGEEVPEINSSAPVKGNIFGDVKLYLNGKEPQIFCEIVNDENRTKLRLDSNVYLNAKYYFAGREDLKLQWSSDGVRGNFSYETNSVGVKSEVLISNFEPCEGVVKASVVAEDGTILATDTSETLKTALSPVEPEEREELTPVEKFFAPFLAVFSELFFAFGFGINILLALIAMPFYELGALLGIGG